MFDNKDEDEIFDLITLEDLLEDHKIIFNMGQRKLLEYLMVHPVGSYIFSDMLKQLEGKNG